MLEYMIEDLPEYRSRGERIMSVLNGSGSVEVLPGRPDVQASDSDFRKVRVMTHRWTSTRIRFPGLTSLMVWRVDRVLLITFLSGSVRLRPLSRRKRSNDV